jgi:hypothetical protein
MNLVPHIANNRFAQAGGSGLQVKRCSVGGGAREKHCPNEDLDDADGDQRRAQNTHHDSSLDVPTSSARW